jgi:hypothetical protein
MLKLPLRLTIHAEGYYWDQRYKLKATTDTENTLNTNFKTEGLRWKILFFVELCLYLYYYLLEIIN